MVNISFMIIVGCVLYIYLILLQVDLFKDGIVLIK